MDNKQTISMVVSDLDGTLLREDLSISPATRSAVAALRTGGIPFVIATGRSFLGMERFYRALELDTPAICYNGAAVFAGSREQKIYERPLPEAIARRAAAIGLDLGLLAPFYLAATSKPRFLELLDGRVSKGETLRYLCDTLNIPIAGTIAFGDGRNDYELLETAGAGIAMPNGHPDLTGRFPLAPADNDHDGLALALQQALPQVCRTV